MCNCVTRIITLKSMYLHGYAYFTDRVDVSMVRSDMDSIRIRKHIIMGVLGYI